MPIIGKLLEKAIHAQLSYYLDSWGVLHPNQHGFRKGKSTGSAIFQFMKNLYEGYDNNQTTNAIYTNYKKAFDTVSQSYYQLNICMEYLKPESNLNIYLSKIGIFTNLAGISITCM